MWLRFNRQSDNYSPGDIIEIDGERERERERQRDIERERETETERQPERGINKREREGYELKERKRDTIDR